MPGESIEALLERNRSHVRSLPSGYFESVVDGQHPPVVSMCCSDSRVTQEGMWSVSEPGWLFTPSVIGNQVWDEHDGDFVVNGTLLYPVEHAETRTVVVVGHTGCGAITAAYRGAVDGTLPEAPGVRKWIELLVPVVEEAIDRGVVDPDARTSETIDRLAEYNVDRQVDFLLDSEEIPTEEDVFGFVYDFQRVYGNISGMSYLVNVNGETDPRRLRRIVNEEYADHVRRLIH